MFNRKLRVTLFVTLMPTLAVSCSSLAVGTEIPEATEVPVTAPLATEEPAAPSPTASFTDTPSPPTEVPSPTPLPPEVAYWVEVEDSRTGVRFAIPCFWIANLPAPAQDPTGLGAFAITNYPDDYVFNFPRSVIPDDAGAIKIDMLFWDVRGWGQEPGVSLEEFAAGLGGDEVTLVSTESVEINGQSGILVTTESIFGIGQFYLFPLSDEVYFGFAAGDDLGDPDVQGVLNSLALTPEVEVLNPGILPGPPPSGLAAPCIPGYEVVRPPTVVVSQENTTCGVDSYVSLEGLVQSVQDRLQARDTGSLRWDNFIHDPFMLGYWRSEGIVVSPDEMAALLPNSLYDASVSGGMTFTNDGTQFPDLDGVSPEAIIDPNIALAEIVYSEGWGLDGQGAAFLYFAQDECGGFYWYGLLFAPDRFG